MSRQTRVREREREIKHCSLLHVFDYKRSSIYKDIFTYCSLGAQAQSISAQRRYRNRPQTVGILIDLLFEKIGDKSLRFGQFFIFHQISAKVSRNFIETA